MMRQRFVVLLFVPLLSAGSAMADMVVTPTTVDARFIRIRRQTSQEYLSLAEIQAFGPGSAPTGAPTLSNDGNDYARTGTMGASFESKVGNWGHQADDQQKPLDGAVPNNGNITQLEKSALINEYVADLGQTRTLDLVRVFGRAGCCQNRLGDYTVSLLADDGTGLPGAEVFNDSIQHQSTIPFEAFTVTQREIRPGGVGSIGDEVVGQTRFVRVRNNDAAADGTLHISELEAFLEGVSPLAGFDNTNDKALLTLGAHKESQVGGTSSGHTSGVNNSYYLDGNAEGGGDTFGIQSTSPYAEVTTDLGADFDIGTIRLWGRAHSCCQNRLNNVSVDLIDSDGNLLSTETYPGTIGNNASHAFTTLGSAFTLQPTDTLLIEMDATNGTIDLLSVGSGGGGDLAILPGAVLDITNLDGDFTAGQEFDVFNFGAVTGTFDTINLPELTTSALYWDLSELYTTGMLTVGVPEPSTALLAILGLTGLALVRRRRR